jgi:phosphate transport system protein
MATEHIVKAYDDELKQLSNMISRMGGLAENQVAMAIEAVVRRDNAAATETIQSDEKVDQLEHEVDQFCVRLLALRQPMAGDLRRIIGALKISSDLERIADYGANVAKRALQLNQIKPVKPLYAIPRMGKLAQEMIKDVLDAFAESDVDKALDVWHRDEEVDEMYTSLFRELLTYMMEDPRNITACTHLLFIAKNIERVGDHATNIAETIHFLVEGGPFSQGRRQTHDGSVLIGLENEVETP